jgi:hypothetical protein
MSADSEDQRRMANEVQRLAPRYFLQTPNRYFPIEPHFLFPCFQFLPLALRIWLVMHFEIGNYKKFTDRRQALEAVATIRLLTRKELEGLFPGAQIYEECFYGLVKSYIVYSGWDTFHARTVQG